MRTFAAVNVRPLLILVGIALAFPARGEELPLALEETGPEVVALRVSGAEALSESAILEGIATRPTGPWPWSDTERLDRIALANDVRRIANLYRLHGYFEARVSERVEPVGRGRVVVHLTIEEGPPTRVTRLHIEGLESFSPERRRTVVDNLLLAEGAVLRAADYEAMLGQLELRLRQMGYARVQADGRVDVFPERRAAEVDIQIATGPVFRYGEIEVRGLPVFPKDKVEDAVRRMLPRGERYSPRAMEEARGRVFELGAFAGVRLELADRPDESPDAATVLVNLEERPANTIGVGGGASVQQNLQQVEVIANYTNLNFLGRLRRLDWRNELAVLFLPTFFRPVRQGLGAQTTLELTEPEIFYRTDLALRTGFQRVFRQAFFGNALTGRAGLPMVLHRRSRITPSFNYERYFNLDIRQPVGPQPLPIPAACTAPCAFAFPGVNLVHDRRDDPMSPQSGYMVLADLEYAFPGLASPFHYLRFSPEVRGYLPLTRTLTIAARARIGALWTLGGTESPIVQRFFGGGEGGHRGFGAEQLSPIFEDADGQFVPLGGNGLWLATAETRWRFGANWGVVAFTDVGNVTVQPLELSLQEAYVAIGLGLRYYTLAGPLRVDVGYRVDRRSRVALDTGEDADSGLDFFVLFVSLGEAF